MRLDGKHVFITGSGRRLGNSLAKRLLELGANVSAHCCQSIEQARALVDFSKQQGLGRVQVIQADLTCQAQIELMVESALEALGPVDILINSASDFYPTPLSETSIEEWDSLFNLNLKAPYFLTKLLAPTMPKGGHVLFVADVHGTRPIKNYGPYCATKAGLISLTKTLAKELAPNIRVNSISPGTVLPPDNASESDIEKAAYRTLLGRVGTPEDFINGVLFLINNSYITGFDLIVDGGRFLK